MPIRKLCWAERIRNTRNGFDEVDIDRHGDSLHGFSFGLVDDSWGGGIELAILTQEYEIEICVINTECEGRIDYFGEDQQYPHRVFLLYNNLHYDPGRPSVCHVALVERTDPSGNHDEYIVALEHRSQH